MNIRADLRGIGIIVLVAAATMAIVARVPAIRGVIFPDAVGLAFADGRRPIRPRPRPGIWTRPGILV